MKRRFGATLEILGALVLAAMAYLLLWPVEIEPASWKPVPVDAAAWDPAPLEGIERIDLPAGFHGPEDVDVDGRGRVVTGLAGGRILQWPTRDDGPTTLADTGGRPLGLAWDRRGRLIVADAVKGLLRIADGEIEVLTSTCANKRLVFTDDVDVAADGTIWFSDASARFGFDNWRAAILENQTTGRLCAWDPATRETREVLTGLAFANGVAVDPRQRFVLVTETARNRIRKVTLAGKDAGVILDGLPGFPDGISAGTNGIFWVPLVNPRNELLDDMAEGPWLRKLVYRLPASLGPAPVRTARILGIDGDGRVRYDLFDPQGRDLAMVTSVEEHGEHLYLGTLSDPAFGRIARPRSTTNQ